MTYADLERRGFRLAVSELRIRYRQPARYDDLVRIRCWVRECRPRRIIFGYAVDRPATRTVLATAETSMLVLDGDFGLGRLPAEVLNALPPASDPVRLF